MTNFSRIGSSIGLLFAILLVSCEYLVPKKKSESEHGKVKVAMVGDQVLYLEEMDMLNIQSESDSARVTDRYIKKWIQRQLLMLKAEENLNLEEYDIERKVNNFRFELIEYEYKKQYLEKTLSKEISEKDIKDYYSNNKDNFELKQNIVRCHYLKLPINSPKLKSVKKWFYSTQESNYNKLKDYGHTHGVSYSFEDSTWIKFNEIALNTPLMSIPNRTNYIRRNKHIVTSDTNFVYFFKINDYKLSNGISPLEFVKDDIKSIILNKRRRDLLTELEKKTYNEAKNDERIKIFK